jgi:Flp pilus assembly protein TadD
MTDDPLDRYALRELTAAEARDLAQKSLDDPDLFDDLTASGLAAAALSAPAKVVRFPRKTRFVVAGAAAAAAIVLVSLYSMRPSQPRETPTSSPLAPALEASAKPGQPILLPSGPEREQNSAPVFRSPASDNRAPRSTGSIVSLADGEAAVDLGSLDGLAKGSDMQVFRNEKFIGQAKVTAVFRERSRTVAAPGVQVNDQVRPAPGVYLDALLQQADAMSARGDSGGARKMVEKAAAWTETANDPPRELERLATWEYQVGSFQAAEKHYQSAEPEASFGALNNLAVLRILRRDYDGAEVPLSRVISTSPKTDIAYARSLNNLGVLAELRGDKRKAEALYSDALRAAPDASPLDRQSLETNLARIKGAH